MAYVELMGVNAEARCKHTVYFHWEHSNIVAFVGLESLHRRYVRDDIT